jgi:hypothetical protein
MNATAFSRVRLPTRYAGISVVSGSIATNVHWSPTLVRSVKRGIVSLLHPAECPDFVALNAATIEVAHLVIGQSRAASPDLDHKPHDRIPVGVGHPLR